MGAGREAWGSEIQEAGGAGAEVGRMGRGRGEGAGPMVW